MATKNTTTLYIPVNWDEEKIDIQREILLKSDYTFVLLGNVLNSAKTNNDFKLEIFEKSEDIIEVFSDADASKKCLKELKHHTMLVFLSAETDDMQSALALAEAGNAILKAGGLGLVVETTGLVFEKEIWAEYMEQCEEGDDYLQAAALYGMFVAELTNEESSTAYSNGMYIFGHKDVIIQDENLEHATELAATFNFHQLLELSEIKNKGSFQDDEDSPEYKITTATQKSIPQTEMPENPFGMWELKKV